MKNILPIAYPPITSYPAAANLLSPLWVHKDECMPWICNQYIQLVVKSEDYMTDWANFYDSIVINNVSPLRICPFYDMQLIDKTVQFRGSEKFTDFIETQINGEYYIETCLDQYYLSCSERYEKEHTMHPTFIYGYDTGEKTILISDFYDDDIYMTKTVSYEEINKSYTLQYSYDNYQIWFKWINLFRYVPFDYKFNLEHLKLSIQDYIDCKDSFVKLKYAFNDDLGKIYYGLHYYDLLIEHCYAVKRDIDIRAFHILSDHKSFMLHRLEYLKNQELLDLGKYSEMKGIFTNLINKTNNLKQIALKYSITGKENVLDAILRKCNEVKADDKIAMIQFLEIMK